MNAPPGVWPLNRFCWGPVRFLAICRRMRLRESTVRGYRRNRVGHLFRVHGRPVLSCQMSIETSIRTHIFFLFLCVFLPIFREMAVAPELDSGRPIRIAAKS
jgi:hypothetical protein